MTTITATEIHIRRGAAAEWLYADEVLNLGEPGYETDTGLLKVGDGATAWSALRYAAYVPPVVQTVDTDGDTTAGRPTDAPVSVWVSQDRPTNLDPLFDVWPAGIVYADVLASAVTAEATARDAAISTYVTSALATTLAAYSNTTATKSLIANAINAYDAGQAGIVTAVNTALNSFANSLGVRLALDNADGTVGYFGWASALAGDGTMVFGNAVTDGTITANNNGTISFSQVSLAVGGDSATDNNDGTVTYSLA